MRTTESLRFVVITPARNEAEFIECTIQSVVAQTARPDKWVIVSDGSTDGTDTIVKRYSQEFPWIELVQLPERRDRHFAGKVMAFNAGYERVKAINYDVIVSLDADITFDNTYFEFLLEKLAANSKLGLVGTPFKEDDRQTYDYRFVSINHVSGACQVFRRDCFEQIGGYVPLKGGSIDHVAVISARMRGWETRTFTEKSCEHHRHLGTAEASVWKSRFKYGIKDYVIGNHPLWQAFRALYQMTQRPYVLSGLAIAAGYAWGFVRQLDRPVSREFIRFHRREQLARLKRFVGGNAHA